MHHRLQRPCLGLLLQDHSHLRAGGCARVPARRRRVRPQTRAGGRRPRRARLASRRIAHPGRVRHHHRQRDAGRPRADGAAVGGVRPAGEVAVPGDPALRERHPVSPADRQPLLQPRAGDSPGRRVVPGGSQGDGVRHRRHVAPVAGRAGGAHQHGVRSGVHGAVRRRPAGACRHPAHRVPARGRLGGHRAGDVAGDAGRTERDGRRGLPVLSRAGLEHRLRTDGAGGPRGMDS